MTVRTRFAPSPTGRLHAGNLRTALFNWLFARKNSGEFVLRIEDTDTARSTEAFELAIMDDLGWAGLDWDVGPVRQSERLAVYRASAGRLVERGLAYRCRCSKERLEELKRTQISKGLPPRYDGACRGLEDAGPSGAGTAIRFRVPEAKISFTDIVHGEMSFDTSSFGGITPFGDFVIIGSDGVAGYNFAAAVDDADMRITHVFRGDDHLSNTPRQILLFNALGSAPPAYAHIPLVLGPDRTPLSKRKAVASIEELRGAGFLPLAVLNACARLGWSPPGGERLIETGEMIREFGLERLSKSPSIFDPARLESYGKEAIGHTPAAALAGMLDIDMKGADDALLEKAVKAARPGAHTLVELNALIAPVIGEPALSAEAAGLLREPHSRAVLKAAADAMAALDVDAMGEAAYKTIIEAVKKATNEKGGRLFMPLRAGLTGSFEGMELVKVFELLGRDRIAARLKRRLAD